MSAAAFSRLLDQFRRGWHESEGALSILEIRVSDAIDPEIEQIIADAVCLPDTAGSEKASEAIAVVRRATWRSQELIDRFKSLCSEAGATLPLDVRRGMRAYAPWLNHEAVGWWIGVIACLKGVTAYDRKGRRRECHYIRHPWELSAGAIEYLRLTTDSPGWPVDAASEVGRPITDEAQIGAAAVADTTDSRATEDSREARSSGDDLRGSQSLAVEREAGKKVSKAPSVRRPPENAFKAWRLRDLTGITKQTELAATLTKQGVPANQGQVSRWLRQVEDYLAAGNVLPNLPSLTSQPRSIDPELIEMGARQDHQTPRQRKRRSAESYDR